MAINGTEAYLWYNVGDWKPYALAVPNCQGYTVSQNSAILNFVSIIGRNLQAVMWSADAQLRTPPSINTLMRIGKLCERATSLLMAEAIAPGVPNMEPAHAVPGPEDFLIYPLPYFQVRNSWMKDYAGFVLMALTDAIQHTENGRPIEISTNFAASIGQYIKRIYRKMSIELLRIDPTKVSVDSFVIQQADYAAYNPAAWFTSTEMIDTVPDLSGWPTQNELFPLSNGIAASQLPLLPRWQGSVPQYPTASPQGDGTAAGTPAPASTSVPAAAATPAVTSPMSIGPAPVV